MSYDNYDAVGNVGVIGDPRFGNQSFAYDEVDRLTQAAGPYGTAAYTYDAAGNQLTLTDSVNNKTTFAYDTLNRRTQPADPGRAARSCTRRLGASATPTGCRHSLGPAPPLAH